VGAIYLLVALANPALAQAALWNTGGMLGKIVPILLVVVLLMTITNWIFSRDFVSRHLGQESGWKGWLYATIGGIIVSGPPYILYPLLGELKKKGLKDSLLAIFLYNRNVKIPFFPVLVVYFGWKFALVLSTYIIIFSLLSGVLFEAKGQN
jgi:uncharacterized membrane protein YraQ (UPF0718 family)